MLYEQHSISAHSAIPPLLQTFAAAAGWTAAAVTLFGVDFIALTAPTGVNRPAPVTYHITANDTEAGDFSTGGVVVRAGMNIADAGFPCDAYVRSTPPQARPTTAAINPSKVVLFGGMAPQPWLGVVIAYGANRFRHVYIGHLDQIGDFTGGEVFHANNPVRVGADYTMPNNLHDGRMGYLFSAACRGSESTTYFQAGMRNAGGAHLVHADNPTPWRKFYSEAAMYASLQANATVLGGLNDGPNDALFFRAHGTYATAQMMVPFNLYASDASNHIFPIGNPAGIRYVDMTGLSPEATVDVGGVLYRVFPMTSKQTNTASYASLPETSGMIGVAYPENSA